MTSAAPGDENPEAGDAGADPALARAILDLLGRRRPGASICPSEAARSVAPDDWRPLMPAVREAAARLADHGRLVVTRGDEVVDLRKVGGPVRLRLPGAGG